MGKVADRYRQCKLRRGQFEQTSWIPSIFAVKGEFLWLQKKGGWEKGWEVMETYECEVSRDEVLGLSGQWKNQRKASDIERNPDRGKVT